MGLFLQTGNNSSGDKKASPIDVLSEGEHRIVSLAAFLADVGKKNHSAPFIFDDPISSLDQPFEEAVVRRLVKLSQRRQVIVFTHRLSLLGLMQEYAKKANIKPDIICVRQETWGTGEPGDTPFFAKKPEKALNSLVNDRLAKARKILTEYGREQYESEAQTICNYFRILLERMVESELLSGIVQRYRRDINTKGKIHELSRITYEDCTLIDDLMTKYSHYGHTQPIETPIALPDPDELQEDMERLRDWREGFRKRPANNPQTEAKVQ